METPFNIIAPENGVVEIRTGESLPLKESRIISIDGNIDSVSNFLKKRYPENVSQEGNGHQFIDNTKVVVIADKEACTIELKLDPENFYGASIKGKLTFDKDFEKLNFNKGEILSKDEILAKYKFAQRFFKEPSVQFPKFVNAFQKMDIVINNTIKQYKDQGGSATASNIREVIASNIPTFITLEMPIFKGFEKKTFTVDIWIHSTSGDAKFEFVSQELDILVETEKERIFNDELKFCSDFVIINK